MYLLDSPNDRRTWVYPTHNYVSDTPTENSLELIEDPQGDIHIEFWAPTERDPRTLRVRISTPTMKSARSAEVKSYRVATTA